MTTLQIVFVLCLIADTCLPVQRSLAFLRLRLQLSMRLAINLSRLPLGWAWSQ
jgi:hypothetical protein